MTYPIYTEEQALEMRSQNNFLIPEGVQEFTVIAQGDLYKKLRNTEDTFSKKGDLMMRIILQFGDVVFWDHLLFGGAMAYKTIRAAKACGLEAEYNNGTLSAISFLGCSGKAVIKHKEEQYTNKDGEEKTRTVHEIEDYFYEGVAAAQQQSDSLGHTNQEVPFDDINF